MQAMAALHSVSKPVALPIALRGSLGEHEALRTAGDLSLVPKLISAEHRRKALGLAAGEAHLQHLAMPQLPHQFTG